MILQLSPVLEVNTPKGRGHAEFLIDYGPEADLLWVVGTVNHKLAPHLARIHAQISDPKWVISFGVCASTGGFYDNYATVQGIDKIIPVDVYIPGCPPRPEQVLDALMMLQDKIQREKWGETRAASDVAPIITAVPA